MAIILAISGISQAQEWNFSSDTFNALGTISETATVEGLSIYASADASITIDANNKSLDEMSFTSRLKLGGSAKFVDGLPSARILAFPVPGNTTITVMGMSSSSSSDRELLVSAGDSANIIGRFPALGASISKGEFSYVGAATTIYIFSPSSGVNVYYLKAEAAAPAKPKVAYVNNVDLVMAETAAKLDNDPIIKLLKNDPNIDLEVLLISADSVVDLSAYAAVIAQEGFSSSAAIYKPGGSLGMGSIPVPFILNKVFTMKAGRGFAADTPGSGGEVPETYSININNSYKSHELFRGMTNSKGVSQIFVGGAADNGSEGTKGLQYATDVVISAENTLLAGGVNDPATATVCINDIPAGSTIGSEVLKARMIALGMNYGAICKDGNNLTADGLTLWRNAVYSLVGLEVPSAKVDNSNEIKDIVASAGMVKINNGAGLAELVLPAGAASATLTIVPVTEGAVVSPATIEASVGNTYEIKVTAPIGGAPKVYTVKVSAQVAGEILYVSSDSYGIYSEARPYDTNVYDALVEAGYSVTMVKKDALNADGFDYTPYAGIVLSGGAGSSNMNGYAVNGYPIPCVSMQNDGPKNNKWGWINDKNAAQYAATKVYDVTTVQFKITNNTHPITAGFAMDEMVTWTLGTPDSADWAGKEIKSFNLTDSIPEAIALASIPADGKLYPTMWAVPAGTSVRSLTADGSYARVETKSNVVLMYPFNDGLLYAAPGFGTLLTKSLDWAINGGAVEKGAKVAYVNNVDLVMAETAATIDNDPIIKLLKNDPNIDLEVLLISADSVVDLSAYAAVIAQEGFSSSAAIYKPGGSLGMGSIPVPFILNKVFTMKAGRGFAADTPGSGGEVPETYSININNSYKSHELFRGMTNSKGVSQIFVGGAADNGSEGTKGLQYATDVVISAENTLLAGGVNDPATATVCINDIPAGSTIGSEVLKARMIALGMNYGAICKDGNNLTADGLTLWRNAVYSLVGLEVPSAKVDNSNEIKDIVASAGMVKINNGAGLAELVLPAGAASATLTIVPVTEGAVVSPATIEASVGNTYEIKVTAPIGGAPKVYTVKVSAQVAGEILYVSSDSYGIYSEARPYDTNVYDALVEAGYSVTMVKKDALNADGFDYTPYAGIVLSGGAGSSNMNGYAVNGYPIPCVSMQNDGPKNNKWGWINDKNAAQYAATKVYDVTTVQFKITNNTHPITAGFAMDEMVTWTLGTPDSADWAGKEIKSFNLTDSIPEAIALASIPADGKLYPTMWAVPAGTSVRSLTADGSYARVETKSNVVLMYPFNDGLLYAAPGFDLLLSKSLDWAINAGDVPSTKKEIVFVKSATTQNDSIVIA
ncbi:MAG: hypothetical protein ACERKD_01440, partial [Prolixibacteraceae bacterium]